MKANFWILTRKHLRDSYENSRLLEEATKRNLKARLVSPEDLQSLQHAPLILCRNSSSKALRSLCGKQSINRASRIATAGHKWKCYLTLQKHGIPMPSTTRSLATLTEFPIVLKLPTVNMGKAVRLCKEASEMPSILSSFKKLRPRSLPLAQEYIPESHGQDIRVMVVGNTCLGATRRKAPEGQFLANIAQGGSALKTALTEEMKAVALKTCEILGLSIAGIDLLMAKQKFLLCEVNPCPNFQGFEQSTGINVAGAMVKMLSASLF